MSESCRVGRCPPVPVFTDVGGDLRLSPLFPPPVSLSSPGPLSSTIPSLPRRVVRDIPRCLVDLPRCLVELRVRGSPNSPAGPGRGGVPRRPTNSASVRRGPLCRVMGPSPAVDGLPEACVTVNSLVLPGPPTRAVSGVPLRCRVSPVPPSYSPTPPRTLTTTRRLAKLVSGHPWSPSDREGVDSFSLWVGLGPRRRGDRTLGPEDRRRPYLSRPTYPVSGGHPRPFCGFVSSLPQGHPPPVPVVGEFSGDVWTSGWYQPPACPSGPDDTLMSPFSCTL